MKLRYPIVSEAWGGFAAMLVALPAAMAYGVAVYSVLGPDYVVTGVRAGFIGAIAIGFVSAGVGGAPRLISGPSAPAAAVLASVGTALLANGPTPPAKAALLLGVLGLASGAFQALYGLLGGGRLMKYIPYPVVAGYLSAVGVMIFVSQAPKFLGLPPSTPFGAALRSPALWQWPAIAAGAVTIIGMVEARRITKAIPAAIVGLLAGTAVYFILGFSHPGLWQLAGNPLLLGRFAVDPLVDANEIAGLFHAVASLGWADLHLLLGPALTLSVLLSVDSLKSCVIVDALTSTRHDSNRTLLGQGLANLASSVLGGMPGSGAVGPTLVNVESGGQTRISGLLEAVFVLVAVLLFGRWIAWLPVAALAGILLVVAFRMFDWSSVQLLRQRSTIIDFIVIAAVVVVAVATNLIAAAGAGVALAMLLFIRDQIRGSVIRRKTRGNQTPSKQHRLPAELAVLEQYGAETTICELQGSLFFGTTDQLFRDLDDDLRKCRYLILDLRRIQSLDYTATHLFVQFETILARRNGWLLFSRVPPRRELRDYLTAHEAVDRNRNTRTFETLDDALQWAEDQVLAEHLDGRSGEVAPLALDEFELAADLDAEGLLPALGACVAERAIAAGESVFRAGDVSDELFLVRRGVVRVLLPLNGTGYHTLATFGRGHFFGEMAFLVGGTRSASAVASTPADLYVISRAKFDAASRARPVLGVKIFARLAKMLALRLRRADAELRAFYDA